MASETEQLQNRMHLLAISYDLFILFIYFIYLVS